MNAIRLQEHCRDTVRRSWACQTAFRGHRTYAVVVHTPGCCMCAWLHVCLSDYLPACLPDHACRYQDHHGVRITDAAVAAAATLSDAYLPDRQLPDKAIDLIDEAAAKVCLFQCGTGWT